jgi:putative ABC transport system substrate-binding protein
MIARRPAFFGVSFALFAASLRATAQTTRNARVGWLSPYPAQNSAARNRSLSIFFDRMQQLGWKQGDNYTFEFRGRAMGESLEDGARALIGMKCDVLIGLGTEGVSLLRDLSGDIPIVMSGVGDPVGAGLVTSLAQPGGKVTGVSMVGQELFGKILSLMSELVPRAKRVDLLTAASNPANAFFVRIMAEAARSQGLISKDLPVRSPDELEQVILSAQADALVVNFDPTFFNHVQRMARAARSRNLPMASNDFGELTRAGGLFSYAPDGDEITRHVADYVDRLLRGAKPAELPVAQPTRYRFIVNAGTASAIGLKLPPTFLARADEVIRSGS